MSNTRVMCVLLAGGLWGVGGTSAQDIPRLEHRADSLAELWRDAQLVVTIQDSLRRTSLPITMERYAAGPLVVIADPSRLPMARATTAAWQLLQDYYGDAAALVAGHPVVLRVSTEVSRAPNDGGWLVVPKDLALADLTRAIARGAAVPRGDRALRDWLGMLLLPGDDPPRERSVVYVELVTAPTSVARRCFGGDRAACADALGLVPLEGAPARWWTANERRRIAAATYGTYFYRSRPALRDLATTCLERGADSACLRLLESVDPGTWPRPLSPSARAVLVRLALDHGGSGAYLRLVTDSTTAVPARLADIAGVPIDSLVDEWLQVVTSSRPKPVAVPWGNAVVALIWFGILMGSALRSSRWRLG